MSDSSPSRRVRRSALPVAVIALMLAAGATPVAAMRAEATDPTPPSRSGAESFSSGEAAIDALDARLAEVATTNGLTPGQLAAELKNDETLTVDRNGELLYVDPPAPGESAEPAMIDESAEAPPVTDPVFSRHSRPGADHTIYLDFDGHTTSGTTWNSASAIDPIVSPPYDSNGDTESWSSSELALIDAAWSRVAEDFSPFDLDVTTEEPSVDALRRTGGGDTQWGVRVVITDDTWANCSCGGHAYIGSFDDVTDEPVFVYNGSLAGVAEAASHEVGHAMLLAHDGTNGGSYYTGHGSGATGWAPLMGASYYKSVTQWSKGEYLSATNAGGSANYGNGPDDLAVIAGLTNGNGFGYRVDDHGDTPASATPAAGTSISETGVIETTDDVDVFQFTTGAGPVTLDLDPWVGGANLDIDARLLDGAGTEIAASNPATALDASFSQTLAEGTYFVTVDGTGVGTPLVSPPTGYTDYASMGQFTLTGSINPPSEGPITGTVTDELTAAPISGAWVTGVSTATGAEVGTITDAQGDYTLPVGSGAHQVRFFDPTGDHAGEWHDDVGLDQPATATATPAGTSGLDAELAPAGTSASISGSVTEDGTGAPIEDAFVAAVRLTEVSADLAAGTTTDSNGDYTLDRLTAGTYIVVFMDLTFAHAFEYLGDTQTVSVQSLVMPAAGATVTADASLAPATAPAPGSAPLAGTVTETGTGAALEDVLVLAVGSGGIEGATETDAAGAYALALDPGDYFLEFVDTTAAHTGEWYEDVALADLADADTLTLGIGGTTVDAELDPFGPTGSIDGTVTSTVSGGLDGVWVEVLDAATGTPVRGAVTDGAGGFTVDSLDAGSYVVRYVDPSGGHTSEFHDDASTLGTAVPVSVAAGASTTVLSALTPI